MNQYQRYIMLSVIAVFVAMIAYPPFHVVSSNGVVTNMGYDWIFSPPVRGFLTATVNISMLFTQWIGVLVVGGLAFFVLRGQGGNKNQDTLRYDDNNKPKAASKAEEKKNQEPFKFFSWKSLILAIVLASFINIIAANAAGTKPAKNIVWTIWWIYLTIEAWKYWRWKALLPFPIMLLAHVIAGRIMGTFDVEYLSWTTAIVVGVLNIGGLTIFYWLLRKPQKVDELKNIFPKKSLAQIFGIAIIIGIVIAIAAPQIKDWMNTKQGEVNNPPFRQDSGGFLDTSYNGQVLSPPTATPNETVVETPAPASGSGFSSPTVSVAPETPFYQDLDRMVPWWRWVNKDPNFLTWLQGYDYGSSFSRHEVMMAAYSRSDAYQVALFFKRFNEEKSTAKQRAGIVQQYGYRCYTAKDGERICTND